MINKDYCQTDSQKDWEETLKKDDAFDQCSLKNPLLLCIPPEGMTVGCPVHPKGHFMKGRRITC